MVKIGSLAVCAVSAAIVGSALAAGADAVSSSAFSAETRQLGPEGVMGTGRIFVSGSRTRTEISQQGRLIVQIVDGARGLGYTLDPARKLYMEQPGSAGAEGIDLAKDPCAGAARGACSPLGTEQVAGRRAVKREIKVKDSDGQEVRTVQWIDVERGVVLGSESSDGTRMSMRMVARELVGNRSAEKWEMTVVRGGGEASRSFQWYDPDLGVAIREEFPGGYSREMTDIRVGELPDSLFVVPADYRKFSSGDPGQPQRP